ncbi:MAG: polyprenyl synthetase family protein [Erysipelotrichaceae bacterium]|nr:polyprenyl synthetase family protein [Erysipelotrichaceae bacterium]
MNSNFEYYLSNRLSSITDSKIKEAIFYALKNGKRFRPELIFSIVKGFYHQEMIAYPYALALEMIHSYSLIHDDLPCMDNDDYRRGRLAVHKQFDEAIAILTGDALLTNAFVVAANAVDDEHTKLAIIKELSHYAGVEGMIYGQLLDIENENKTDIELETLQKINDYKTGALFKCALFIGMHICKDEKNYQFYDRLGALIGRIFQIQDDLFDKTKSLAEMGKLGNSDEKNNKKTIVDILGIDETKKILKNEFYNVYKLLNDQAFDTTYLRTIIEKMENR